MADISPVSQGKFLMWDKLIQVGMMVGARYLLPPKVGEKVYKQLLLKSPPDIMLVSSLISNPINLPRNSIIDEVRCSVLPELGSVILCDLSPIPGLSLLNLNVEHTGIYAGNNKIIHRNGDGFIEMVTPNEFLQRLNGYNAAINCYVSCNGDKPVKNKGCYNRAMNCVNNNNKDGYDLFNKNCHSFTKYCLNGNDNNKYFDFTFTSLENLLISEFGVDNWRIWDY